MGNAKSKRRPVTSTISIPREAASTTALKFSAGSCARLSSSVPSISSAIILTVTPLFYRIWASQGGGSAAAWYSRGSVAKENFFD